MSAEGFQYYFYNCDKGQERLATCSLEDVVLLDVIYNENRVHAESLENPEYFTFRQMSCLVIFLLYLASQYILVIPFVALPTCVIAKWLLCPF